MTQLRGNSPARRISADAVLLALAVALSYIEFLFSSALPLLVPGIRFGFANLAVMIAFYRVGKADAALISLSRTVISFLLFGSAVSFFFSLCGALLSYLFLLFSAAVPKEKLGYIGISCGCAALHITGQFTAAVLLLSASVISLAPVCLLLSVPVGALNGFLMIMIDKKVRI